LLDTSEGSRPVERLLFTIDHAWLLDLRLADLPAAFADLIGEGARVAGGRWNSPGRAVVTASETAALAVLEVRVHLDLEIIRKELFTLALKSFKKNSS
jgi:RES domain-containing protein